MQIDDIRSTNLVIIKSRIPIYTQLILFTDKFYIVLNVGHTVSEWGGLNEKNCFSAETNNFNQRTAHIAGQNTQRFYIIFNGKQSYALFYTTPISFLHLHLTYYIYVRRKDFYSCKEHLQQ